MPIITTAFWEMFHEWDSNKWQKWTEEMMLDELRELDRLRLRYKMTLRKLTLSNLIRKIVRKGRIRIKNKEINFESFQSAIETWGHITATCKNFGREFLSQSESRLVCFKGMKCTNLIPSNRSCPEFEPMAQLRSIAEIIETIKSEKVVFT